MVRTARNGDELPRIFTPDMARAAGAAAPRSRRKDIHRQQRDLWVRAAREGPAEKDARLAARRDVLERVRAIASLYPDAVVTHETAAFLHGMPLPKSVAEAYGVFPRTIGFASERSQPPTIHVLRHSRAAGTKRAGVKVWTGCSAAADLEVHQETGIPLTSMRLTLLFLARTWQLRDVVAVVDWMVRLPRLRYDRQRFAHDTLEGIRAWLDGLGKRRGVVPLRRAIQLARVGADSPMETFLRLALQDAGLPEPECNARIEVTRRPRTVSERVTVQPDLLFRDHRVVVEYQGKHHEQEKTMVEDLVKREALTAEGWTVVEINATHMGGDARIAVARVEEALRRNGWRR
jgi:hypothetical protein